MITFKSFLAEIFQQHYPYEETSRSVDHNDFDYHFQSEKGHHYIVNINHHRGSTFQHIPPNEKHAEVSFEQRRKERPNHYGKTDVTHNEKHSSSKVFSTVHHIIKQHVEKHGVTHLHFSADDYEPTRVKLYHHMAKKLGHHYTSNDDNLNGHTHFTVHPKAK